jgi:hypothetical protein
VVNKAQFVAIAEADWNPAKPDKVFPMVSPIEIQLHITNLSKGDLLFPTFKTFGVKIFDLHGKEIKNHAGRQSTNHTRPILIPAGASYPLCRRAELRFDEKAAASELLYYDGTGSQTVIGPIRPGRYNLVFWYAVSADVRSKREMGIAPVWVDEVITNEVPIAVSERPTRGIVSIEEKLTDSAEPLRMCQSKPVSLNNAKFVLVAQEKWKSGRGDKGVSVDIQEVYYSWRS